MRKRSKYRPKPVLQNPLGYVLESLTPIAKHDSVLVELKVKNHYAMAMLTQGKANRKDIDVLIASVNMTEALFRLGFGTDYRTVIDAGLSALLAVAVRGKDTDRFILRSEEMKALNEVMELHDAQLDICTVKDIENGIKIVNRERPKMTRIKESQDGHSDH